MLLNMSVVPVQLSWSSMHDLRWAMDGLAREDAGNTCLKHLVLSGCDIDAGAGSWPGCCWQTSRCAQCNADAAGSASAAESAYTYVHASESQIYACNETAETLSQTSWGVAMMHQLETLDLSHNAALGAAQSQGGHGCDAWACL